MTQKQTLWSVLALLLAFTTPIFAQDLHFTQFNASPLQLNPANTGGFQGTARVGGIYRDQWNYLANVRGFRTPLIYVDAPIVKGLRKQDWIGVGVNLFQDQAGSAGLTRSSVTGSAAYHLGFGKNNATVLALGVGGGMYQRGIKDRDRLLFEDAITTGGQTMDFTSLIGQNISYWDLGAGLNLTTSLNSNMKAAIGASFNHLLKPEYNLKSDQVARMPLLTTIHGKVDMALNPKWSLTPQFLFQTIAGSNEMVIQGIAGYNFDPAKKIVLNAGLGYRLRDAAQVLLGASVGSLRAGIAYDVNVSGFTAASNGHGAFELQASYIFSIPKVITVKPVILCPRF